MNDIEKNNSDGISAKAYYAHSGDSLDFADWQLLSNHLNGVGNLAEGFAQIFGGQDFAKQAGLLHDIGKYCVEFMARLQGSSQRVDHATAGAKVAVERWGEFGKLLAFCIAGHHAGLANGVDGGEGRSTLKDRLDLHHGKNGLPILDEVWKQEIKLIEKLNFQLTPSIQNRVGFQVAFFTRMIFSCLIDADRTDTSQYYEGLKGRQAEPKSAPSLLQLKTKLFEKLSEFEKSLDKDDAATINHLRQHILQHSIAQAKLEPGLFSLTVPTGGGKTYTSMAFALEHAISHQASHQFRRIIYVIPFTSIIEQNAKVFKDTFEEYADAIIEHHSAFDATKLPSNNAKDTLKQAMESWDAPVIVTTAVQFFESLFSDKPSQCRKLHNIAGSVIILDEAQTLPLHLLRPTMAAIDELALNYKCSVVLCTATQPALDKEKGFVNGFENVREIAPKHAPSGQTLFEALKRVQIKPVGVKTDDELLQELTAREQVLVIVNNRRHARSLYEKIQSLDGATHLTTLMCAKHRTQVLEKVRADLKAGKPCRLISTSLIEAGVDVDFPCVMRAEAGLDSIAQAAGRCNREGKRSLDVSEVFVFQSPDWKAPPELEQLSGNMREVIRNHQGDLLAPEALTMYFQGVYWSKGKELDSKNLLESHRNHLPKLSFPFQNIARDYSMIDAHLKPVIIEFDEEAATLIESLNFAESVGGIARQLQRYLVQIPDKGFKELVKSGAIQTIDQERFGDQFWVLINKDLYNDVAGLSWENPTYIKSENLVCS